MKKTIQKVGMALLLLAGIGFVALQVGPACQRQNAGSVYENPESTQENPASYSPPFTQEGVGSFLSATAGDTLQNFRVEVAERPDEVQYGMMYRTEMAEDMAMVFLMGAEEPQSFWMRNTYVSLDIVFINSQGTVVSIQENCTPLTDTPRPSEGPANVVVEVPGGTAKRIGLAPGDRWVWKRM
jgi:uncharacterized membrane protein (UPF0127 family)